jgi:hypothetical protein
MPQSIQQSAQPVYPGSASLRLLKVEAGINGLLPTSWAPPTYSISLLSKLRFALDGNGLLRQAVARSFLAHTCKRKNQPQQTEKPIRGLDNVGFIAASRFAPCIGGSAQDAVRTAKCHLEYIPIAQFARINPDEV